MESEPVRCPGCGKSMVVGVGAGGGGRQYHCDGCGSTVAGIAVFHHVLGDGVANAVWSGEEPEPGEASPVVCGFCFGAMHPRQPKAGRAAICRTCQVMWLDREAMEALSEEAPPRPRLEMDVVRCDNCGAAVPSSLDERCRYCGSAFVLAPPVIVAPAPAQRGDLEWGALGTLGGWLARAVETFTD
jgi:DNA-directed RNA polymerase subunit M/transcription elongation factor TFIIS